MSHSDYYTELKAFRKFCKTQLKNLKLDTKHKGCNHKDNRRTQKFFIHSHNLDLENALKYHQKLSDYGSEMLEKFAEEELKMAGKCIVLLDKNNEKVLENDSNGYVKFADILKSQYECREDMIDDIKALIAMRN